MRRVIIDGQLGEIRAAVLSDETLVDLLIERTTCPNPVGARYLGRVTAFNGEMQSAFVDIGLDRPALLPRKSAMTRLNEGDRAVVEVVRAPSLGKGAKLKQDIPNIDETDGRVPRLLTPAKPLLDFLTRYAPADIRVSGQVALAELRAQAANFAATATVERADAQPFADLGLEEAIEGLTDPEVRLESGGRLFIEPVRTLTAIDVDTGAQAVYAGASGLTPEAANRAAIPEIVRQIRLRGLSGLIVIDFLEVATKQARNEISAELQSAFADDPTPTDVGPMRASGLMEVTRQRTRWPLHMVLRERCGHAESGLQPRADTVAREILRGIAREARARPGKALSVRAAPEVVDAFEDSVADARGELEQRLGQALCLHADRTLSREAWEIEEGSAG